MDLGERRINSFLGEPRSLGASAIGFLLNLPQRPGNERTVLQLVGRAYRRGAEEPRLAEESKSRISLNFRESAPRAAFSVFRARATLGFQMHPTFAHTRR